MSSYHRASVNPDPVLTGLLHEYGTGGPFGYPSVCPTRMVPGQKFRYGIFDFGPQIAAHYETKMAPNGPANQVQSPTITWSTGVCQRFGLKDFIGDHERGESTNEAALEASVVGQLTNNLRIGREIEMKAGLDAAANATTLSGTAQWNNASALIEKSIDDGRESFIAQCGFEPNVILVPPACWNVAKRDGTLRGYLKYQDTDVLDGMGGIRLDNFLGLTWVVPGPVQNSANLGATASVARLWATDKVYLMWVDHAAASNDRIPTACYWAAQEMADDLDFAARTWRDPHDDIEQDWYEVWEWHDYIQDDALIHRLDDVLA